MARKPWDPTGRHIVSERFDHQHEYGIFITDTLGMEPRWIAWGAEPAWSPDGEWIAFSSKEGIRGTGGALRLIRPDGTGARVLISSAHPEIDARPLLPTWSPDGERLASSGRWARTRRGMDLRVIRRDGSGLRRLSPDPH